MQCIKLLSIFSSLTAVLTAAQPCNNEDSDERDRVKCCTPTDAQGATETKSVAEVVQETVSTAICSAACYEDADITTHAGEHKTLDSIITPTYPAPEPTHHSPPASSAIADDDYGSHPGGEEYSNGDSGKQIFNGEITYYDLGMGACGEDDTAKDYLENIVALSHLLMGPQSNDNAMCGRTITIKANGHIATAIVRDKCMGCKVHDIDVSRKVFLSLFGSLERGRAEVQWFLND